MKKLVRLILFVGIVTYLVKYLNGDTAAGEWHNA